MNCNVGERWRTNERVARVSGWVGLAGGATARPLGDRRVAFDQVVNRTATITHSNLPDVSYHRPVDIRGQKDACFGQTIRFSKAVQSHSLRLHRCRRSRRRHTP